MGVKIMKIVQRKILPIMIAISIAVIFNIVFIVLSHTSGVYIFRFLIKLSFAQLLILIGINHFFYKRQRVMGIYMWFMSGIILSLAFLIFLK